MTKDKIISVYTDAETKQEIERLAETKGMSLSAYCTRAIENQLARDLRERRNDDLSVEDRLEELVAYARDEVEAATEELVESQAIPAVHMIALWELIADNYGPAQRKAAMTSARQRLDRDTLPDTADGDSPMDGTGDGHSSTPDDASSPSTGGVEDAVPDSSDDDLAWDFDTHGSEQN